ncbi:MAG: hypothetical protein KJ904_02465 [Alphaproteobacteria bacterium]|nr:hypothetical protein [Alphaproteobacteria bacterium]MBU0798737.1 hypothetical protein [Alphaproteobacteria bacterium]MBU0886000.1 hypothetical protein [Alphaproteobacteria bacterium]MBU1811989.1 hypothetical protein [Alphaproteobacteria bacterium]MBU2092214.1 hypothetical protein [Alphaproteobacteria bacterium]
MAKSQKRSNREVRKPKASKPSAAVSTATVSSVMSKNAGGQAASPKKKG